MEYFTNIDGLQYHGKKEYKVVYDWFSSIERIGSRHVGTIKMKHKKDNGVLEITNWSGVKNLKGSMFLENNYISLNFFEVLYQIQQIRFAKRTFEREM